MKFSIITVAFNSATTIRRALQSVADQDHPDIEHIVVDGGSKDGTQDIVQEFGKRISRFISEPDRGIYDAMNKGLNVATGDVIAFLNSDDYYCNGKILSTIAAGFDSDQLDLLLGDVAFFRPSDPGRIVRRYTSRHFTPKKLAWGWMPAHPATFVRKRVFECAGPFRIDFQIAGDYEWIARACTRCAIEYKHIALQCVFMQSGGISTRGLRSTFLLNREVMRACRSNGIDTNWAKILSKYPAKLLEYAGR